ncbi:MAG: glycosyltransferase family 9 protein [Candidatus Omnitrophica bacterium]|nr:glycosyltransferase family 9 protein [Candidatus Omnitrophota bacterium]MBU1995904.1 glycosyltransferase family 9 protein [Candidatus Omnitrophota bacterium]
MKKELIKKILVISLTNIGDVVLTFPVIDILIRDFPEAELSVVVGPRAESIVCTNPRFKKVYVYNKKDSILTQGAWVWELIKEHFDLLVDLRNTALPVLVSPKYHTSIFKTKSEGMHMKEKHLKCLSSVYEYGSIEAEKKSLFISDEDKGYVMDLRYDDIGEDDYVVVAPSSASDSKRWSNEGFAKVADHLVKNCNMKIVFVGDNKDREVTREIAKFMEHDSVNLCGRTDLVQLAELLRYCRFAIVNDSAPMHVASYMNVPILALFGPTQIEKYGPWSKDCFSLRNNKGCEKCKDPESKIEHSCMMGISSEDVIKCLQENLIKY